MAFEYVQPYQPYQPQQQQQQTAQQQQQQQSKQFDQMGGLLTTFQEGGGIEGLKGLFGYGSEPVTASGLWSGGDAASLSAAEAQAGLGPSASTSAGSSGGIGAAGIGGVVLAAIGAQHALSKDTDTTVEGVETGDAFSGQFGTEPWLGWVHDKLDLSPTAGEKFDAAVKNDDWGEAFKRSFEMSDYWADPVSSWVETAASGLGMDEKTSGWLFNPTGEILRGLS